jgi:N utilization substance protein A
MINEEFISALRQIAAERHIEVKDILDAISEAVLTSYTKEKDLPKENLEVCIDENLGNITVYLLKEVVNEVVDFELQIGLKQAEILSPGSKIGDFIKFDITPEGDFGRIAAQSARQVIKQKISEAERNKVIESIINRIGSIITVQVEKILPNLDIQCSFNGVRAILPKSERIHSEYYRIGESIKVLLVEIVNEPNGQKYLDVARGSEKFLKGVFELEVPEIASGSVEIVSIAREAGSRSKIAVKSNSPAIDPRGACIGQRGMRISAILNYIKVGNAEEKVDIIEYSDDAVTFIKNALQPAEAKRIEIVDKKAKNAVVYVEEDKLSLAIGKEGQNARLASKLTGWNIEITKE